MGCSWMHRWQTSACDRPITRFAWSIQSIYRVTQTLMATKEVTPHTFYYQFDQINSGYCSSEVLAYKYWQYVCEAVMTLLSEGLSLSLSLSLSVSYTEHFDELVTNSFSVPPALYPAEPTSVIALNSLIAFPRFTRHSLCLLHTLPTHLQRITDFVFSPSY
jgi:hypothetical protein